MTLITAFDTTGQGRTGADIKELIPAEPTAVFGYIDGLGKWPASAWSIFGPTVIKKRISIEANVLADVFDYENGTASIEQVQAAVNLRTAASLGSVVYMNYDTYLTTGQTAFKGMQVAFWLADWTGVAPAAPIANAAAQQYASFPNYDISLVDTEKWPGW